MARVWRDALFAAMSLLLSGAVHAQTTAEMLQERRESLQGMLDASEAPPSLIASIRHGCAGGIQPDSIHKDRALGADSLPDASDYCAVAMYRTARDGQLLPFYRQSLIAATGSAGDYEKLPAAIGASVVQYHSNQVPLGNGKAAPITPALAWDAGFTVAYQQRPAAPANLPQVAALKPVAERCLGQHEPNLSLCYSIGFMYGIRAVHGMAITAAQ